MRQQLEPALMALLIRRPYTLVSMQARCPMEQTDTFCELASPLLDDRSSETLTKRCIVDNGRVVTIDRLSRLEEVYQMDPIDASQKTDTMILPNDLMTLNFLGGGD